MYIDVVLILCCSVTHFGGIRLPEIVNIVLNLSGSAVKIVLINILAFWRNLNWKVDAQYINHSNFIAFVHREFDNVSYFGTSIVIISVTIFQFQHKNGHMVQNVTPFFHLPKSVLWHLLLCVLYNRRQ